MRTRDDLLHWPSDWADVYLEAVTEVRKIIGSLGLSTPPAADRTPDVLAFRRGYNQALQDLKRKVRVAWGTNNPLEPLFRDAEALTFPHEPKVYYDPVKDWLEVEFSSETYREVTIGNGVVLRFGVATEQLVGLLVENVRRRLKGS